ncbi:MAG: DUF2061 domain-containing protein [Candidatus Lokiarchaeota archaeon]|nr:DUF2061 domain-containing protein [Candidatus Lokiarchaeota archaeon]
MIYFVTAKNIEWKSSLIKSLIYRAITVVLGTFTAYILTGSIAIATGTALLTELVQGINYFIYELIWSNIARRKLEKRIIEKIKRKEIKLNINYSSIKELVYVFSQIDTFDPKLYLSTLNIFTSMLENEELEELREDIQKYKDHFVRVHSKRKLFFPEN